MARVTALLAVGPGYPDGDIERGLELTVCLNGQAAIDASAFDIAPLPWTARRFWPDRAPWFGHLLRTDEGWALTSQDAEDDEPLWDLQSRVVRPGDYITLRRPDGEELVFRIVSVEAE